MLTILPAAIAVSALAAIIADWREQRPPLFKLLKPLTTLLIIALCASAPDSAYRNLLLAGLALSLIGDVALMYESDRAFVTGLSSFLLAHLLFVYAFIHELPLAMPAYGWAVVAYALVFAALLLPRAPAPLRIPVLVYGLVLCAMGLAALLRWQSVGNDNSAYALAGALLFLLSDSALGVRKFFGFYRGAQGLILSTYWAAIALIAGSAQSL
ncbi:Uncharacterized membrane protein YhhN [Solimonas aquatica]|uniref:Uncharacterized membrane protein YhhN n=1 Tax=Solimonas aquatica TaxID=489703 RepID=A0A1H9F9S1_9GAMM|nr:lysoplasmalogenase [Solimonas aquatica]SEQ34193.1 Uncharacterized membrane protein YhhN [Solimonas aquatica]